MTAAEAHELIAAKPFRPFRIEMKDGRRYPVPSVFDANAYRTNLLVGVEHDPKTGIAETVEYLRYEDIAGYELLLPEPAPRRTDPPP